MLRLTTSRQKINFRKFDPGRLQFFNFLPQLDYVDMDGPLLLTQDVATGLHYDFGKVTVNNQPGLGIEYTGLYNKVL